MRNTISNLLTPKGRWLPTLLLLFTLGIGQMWGTDITVTPPTPNNASNPFSTGLYVMSVSGTGSKLSSGAITTSTNGAEITINFQATKSDMYIKTITFNSLGNGTLSSDDGTFDGQVFTATGNKNSVNVVLASASTKKGTVKVTNVVVNTGTNVVESITFTGVDSGDGKKATFTSSVATSALSSITTDASAFSVSSGKLSWTNGKKVILTAESNIKYVAFSIADGKMYSTFSATEDTYNSANYSWSGSSKTVTLTNGSGGGREIKGLYVIIDPIVKHHVTYDLGDGTGTTPTQADVAENAKFTLHDGTTSITAPSGQQFAGWNDGSTTYLGGAEYTMGTDDVELTAVWETAKTNPTATFSNGAYVVGASALDLSGLWSSNSDGAVTYALKVASEDATVNGTSFTATKAGSYVVTASQAATSTYNAISKEATITVTWPATGAATITYNVKVGTSQTTLATDKKEANSASISNLVGFTTAGELAVLDGGGKAASSPKIATPTAKNDAQYVYVTFDVASNYIFTINSVTTNMVAVSNPCDIEVELSDATTNEALSYNQTNNNDPGADHEFEFAGKAYEGTVTLKIYAYGESASSYRIGKPLTISGTVAVKPSPAAPSISAPDADQAAVYDLNDVIAPLEITASGYPTPTYQWYSNSSASTTGATAIEGAQSASYTPANNVASNLYYYCVATNSQGTATSHYFHVTVNAPAVPTIYTETTALTLTSNKVATDSKKFTFSGANLGDDLVKLVLAFEVDGITLSTPSVTPTAGAIADTEVTVSYKSLLDVAEATVDLYIKQGETTLKTIVLTYSSTAGIEDLTSISAATTWNWDGAADAAYGTLGQNDMIVLANADVTWDAGFNALAIAGKLQHYYRDSKYAQGHELKFNTTIPGRVTVTFSNTGGKDIARAPRITDVNGSYAPTAEEDGSKNTTAKTYSHNVAAGDVLIAGFEMQTGTPANMLRFYKVEFVPTYTVAYAAGEHGSGDMTDANAYVAGDEVTLLANTFTPATGYVWSGWTVKDANNDDVAVSEGKFTMPASNVTVTAQWLDNSNVARIGDAYYTTFAEALTHAADGEIVLLQDIDVTAQIEIAVGVTATIDLAGHKIEYTGTSTLPSGVILVHNGASLTINDSSDPDAGSIVAGNKAYAAIALTKAGDDATNPAVLVINGGIFSGYYYGITGNGSRNNTDITINGGTITGTVGIAIYHPQVGTLTVNNGTLTGEDAAIEMRAGTLVINDGTFTATATEFSCNPNGSGSTTSGAAIAIAQHTTKKDIEVTINGGTFNGVKALNESNPQVNDPAPQVDLAVKGGDFTGEVSTVDVDHFISGGSFDAPVSNENCATGWVPAPADPITGKYSVTPKDAASLIKAVATAKSQDIEGANLTGVFKGAAHIETSNDYKMDTKKYFMVQLVAGQNFQAGDIVKINVSAVNDCNGFTIYSDIESDGNFIPANLIIDTHDGTGAAAKVSAGINEVKLPETFAGSNKLYVGRASGADKYLNAGINQVEVVRIQNPQLAAITIDTRDGVIDEANKTVAVQIPHEADLAALTVVPTIVWNEAAATNSIVVNDGGAWVESPSTNSYKLTDKDGDYTIYTITLTRDVPKHAVKFYDGETLLETLEVEDATSIAAGDVPADPTKEDYIFQGWAETAGGDVVDVTSFTISAAKNFYAKWASDDAIKLFNGNVLNTTNFISPAATTIEISSVEYPCLVEFSSNRTSLGGATPADMVQYNATTDEAKIKMTFYNNNSGVKKAILYKYEEGAEAPVKIEIEVPGQTIYTTDYYTFNSSKNRSFYVCMNDRSNIRVLQVKVIDNGANPVKQFGQIGYSLNLNKGRLYAKDGVEKTFEGWTLTTSSEYKVYNNSNLATKAANSFTIASPTVMHVERSGGKYYVYQDPEDKGTLYSANADIELNTTGTWYISSETASSAASFTKIEFLAPKCEKPTVADLANVELCAGEPYTELTVSATKSDEGTLHYAWFKVVEGDDDLAVGTDAASFTPAADGEYYVIVTNTLAGHQDNAATSNTISVAHFASVAITTAPEDVYKHTGLDATLSVVATGKNLTYEWFTCDNELGTNPVAIVPAETAADLNLTAIESGIKYYQVVVTDECGTSESAVAKVEGFDDLPLQDVTGNMTWDFSKANDGTAATSNLCNEAVMANVNGIKNNADFKSDNIMATANKFANGKLQASMLKIHTTLNGFVKVIFSHTGNNKTDGRALVVNGTNQSELSHNQDPMTYKCYVPAGDVVLTVTTGDGGNMLNFTSVEFIPAENMRDVTPGKMGTFCTAYDVTMFHGAEFFVPNQSQNSMYIEFVSVDALEAGHSYLYIANANAIEVVNEGDAVTTAVEATAARGMVGYLGTGKQDIDNDPNNIVVKNNHLYYAYNNWLTNGRAYIDKSKVDELTPMNNAPGRRLVVGFNQNPTGIEDIISDAEGTQKVIMNGQLYILRDGKMYNAQGQLMK